MSSKLELLLRGNKGKELKKEIYTSLIDVLSNESDSFISLEETDALFEAARSFYDKTPGNNRRFFDANSKSEIPAFLHKQLNAGKDANAILLLKHSLNTGGIFVNFWKAIDNFNSIIQLDGDSLVLIARDKSLYVLIDLFEDQGKSKYEVVYHQNQEVAE